METSLPTFSLKKRVFIIEHPLFYVSSCEKCAPADVKFVGLDCECVQRNELALIQLTGPTGTLLVHVARFPGTSLCSSTISTKAALTKKTDGTELPEELVALLGDASILKCGVNVHSEYI